MADVYNIDSHKLMYHPERVAQWLRSKDGWEKAKSVYPIYVEVSPIGACNHRCVFCAVDYIGYKPRSLDAGVLNSRIREMAELGVKSIMFCGEGEPSLWQPLPETLDVCTEVHIDTAMTTNMVPFNEKNIPSFVRNCSWIKTSINAGTQETYAKIHGTQEEDFPKVLDNFRTCVKLKREEGYRCTIGAQMLLLPENADEAYTLGKTLKEIGVDYLVIKPHTQPLYSKTRRYEDFDYQELMELGEKLKDLDGDGFNLIFRAGGMRKTFEKERGYENCMATPFFWAYVMSDGCIYGCLNYLLNDKFNYGNINESTFKEIWEGERRRESFEFIRTKLDVGGCRLNCRMDEINKYLWRLSNPREHDNFI